MTTLLQNSIKVGLKDHNTKPNLKSQEHEQKIMNYNINKIIIDINYYKNREVINKIVRGYQMQVSWKVKGLEH